MDSDSNFVQVQLLMACFLLDFLFDSVVVNVVDLRWYWLP